MTSQRADRGRVVAIATRDVTTFAAYLPDVGKSPLIVDDRRQPVHTVLDPDLWPRTFEGEDCVSCRPARLPVRGDARYPG